MRDTSNIRFKGLSFRAPQNPLMTHGKAYYLENKEDRYHFRIFATQEDSISPINRRNWNQISRLTI